MSGYPTFTSIPRVDGLSTDPWVLGRHRIVAVNSNPEGFTIHLNSDTNYFYVKMCLVE